MWQREMTLDELNDEGCGTEGDVVSLNTLKEKGASTWTQKEFASCNDGKVIFTLLKICPVVHSH